MWMFLEHTYKIHLRKPILVVFLGQPTTFTTTKGNLDRAVHNVMIETHGSPCLPQYLEVLCTGLI